jgi:serine/threonine-protein kinase
VNPSGVGQQLGDYRLEEIIGQGGMGVVYRATQLGLERTVAVKVIAPGLAADDTFRERFQREARMLAHVDHPHVIPIHHAGEADGQLFLSMRWVDGHDLAQEIRASPQGMDAERALLFLRQIGGALDAVHADGLIHRDIKPANVLIESRSGGDHAYLTDFGAGRELDSPSEFTRTGQWLGTVDYIAPETLEGITSGTMSDLYGLACVVFEMLAGAPPFRRDTRMATQLAHQYDPPPSIHARRPDLPVALDAVFARALSKNPDIRYGSSVRFAEAFADALKPAAGGDTITGETAGAPVRRAPRGSVLRERAAALAARARAGLRDAHAPAPRALAIGAGIVVAVIVAIVALASGGGKGGTAASAKLTRAVGVALLKDEHADDVQSDEDRAFILDAGSRKVIPIENQGLAIGDRIKIPGRARSMLFDPATARIWLGLDDGTLIAIGRRSGAVKSRLQLGFTADRLKFFANRIVAIARKPGRAVLVDPDTSRVIGKPVDLGGTATGALGYGSSLLVIADGRLSHYDTHLRPAGAVAIQGASKTGALDLAGGPGDIVWIADAKNGTVLRVDPATGKTSAPPIKLAGRPQSVTIDPSSAWVAVKRGTDDDPADTVERIGLRSGRVLSTTRIDYLNGRMTTRGFRNGVYVKGSRPGSLDGIVLLEPTSSKQPG